MSIFSQWKEANKQEAIARNYAMIAEQNMKSAEKEAVDYRKGFHDGISANHKFPQMLQVMGYSFDQIIELILKNEEGKMHTVNFTRTEAIKKCHGINHPETLVQALEALGLIEFKPEPKVISLFASDYEDVGVIRIERWPEGIVIWVGGEIRWKSFSNSY